MNRFRTIAGFAAILSLSAPAAAQTACMSDAEVNGLVAYMAPAVLRSAAITCGPSLGSTGFLAGGGEALAGRYQANADRSWPQAKTAMLKLMSKEQSAATRLIGSLSDNALRELVNAGFLQAVTSDIKVKDCPKIDRLVRSMAALPPEPVLAIVAGIMGLSKNAPFPLCADG